MAGPRRTRPEELNGQLLFLGATTRAGFNPILADDMYLYCLHQTDDSRPHLTRHESHALLIEQLAEYGGLVGEIRGRLTPDSRSYYGPLYTSFIAGPWHRGRVILIGDAAHATPPHLASGAGIAIEDAIVLARCLRESDTVAEAFALFMEQRYERCGWSLRTRVGCHAGISTLTPREIRRPRSRPTPGGSRRADLTAHTDGASIRSAASRIA